MSSLDRLSELIEWARIDALLVPLYPASKGEPAWPPLAMFKALLLAVWYDLSDVKLAEALDDRASFRRFCGFSGNEATPERTTFVRFRRALIAHGLDRVLFESVTAELKARAITVKAGTLVDATIIASASEADGDGRWVKHRGRAAVHGFKAHVGADATTALVEKISVTPANVNDGRAGPGALPDALARCSLTAPVAARIWRRRARPRRHAADRGHRDVGPRRTGDPGSAGRLERADPPRPRPHREDLRHLEALLRIAAHAMARPRPRRRPGSLHRHRLQPDTQPQHPRRLTGYGPKRSKAGTARAPGRTPGPES